MIFTDDRDLQNDLLWSNVPLFMSIPNSELYDYFRFNAKYPATYIKLCKDAVNSDEVKPTKMWVDNIFQNRYMIYQNMLNRLNFDHDFFIRNAALARWNDKGYFNLMGGKSRSTFLISRDFNYVPLKILKEDYDKWYNDAEFKNISIDEDNFLEPIEHPAFFDIQCDNAQFYFLMQRALMKFLAEYYGHPKFKSISILDVSKNNGFIARALSKVVREMDVMKSQIDDENLFFALKNLLSAKNLNTVSDDSKKYDVVITDEDSPKNFDAEIIFVSYDFENREKFSSYKKLGNGIKNYRQYEYAVKRYAVLKNFSLMR